jgi:uncharacterized protein RhaS with RHS repeats
MGRYVQSDPIGLAGGMNRFGYALQNPARLVDPDGLNPAAVCLIPGVSAACGAAAAKAVAALAGGAKAVAAGAAIAGVLSVPSDSQETDSCSLAANPTDEAEDQRKRCQSLKDSILETCARLSGRKKFACFQAADTTFRQCMGWE